MQPMVRGSEVGFLGEVTCKEWEGEGSTGGSSRGNSMCKASEFEKKHQSLAARAGVSDQAVRMGTSCILASHLK